MKGMLSRRWANGSLDNFVELEFHSFPPIAILMNNLNIFQDIFAAISYWLDMVSFNLIMTKKRTTAKRAFIVLPSYEVTFFVDL